MAKDKVSAPSILEAIRQIKKGTLLPVYYFFGIDDFIINDAYQLLEKKIAPLITTEFDKQIVYGSESTTVDIINAATAFPFGSDKKFIIVKESDKLKDKKVLSAYSLQPTPFTILLFLHHGEIQNQDTEPFISLYKAGYLFEGKDLKGATLIEWLLEFAVSKGFQLSKENAQTFVDIVGENRSMLEQQFEKIENYLDDKKEISVEAITALSTALKEFNIFDLLYAIGKRKKAEALKIAINIYEKDNAPIAIIAMLNKYFTGLLRMNEMNEKKIDPFTQARIIGTNRYYLKDYENARRNFSDFQIFHAIESILKADIQIKTSFTDERTMLTVLISEILSD